VLSFVVMNRGILTGVRVIDLTQALAGPYCTQLLADFGADVIKIERPGSGDQSRGWGPPFLEGESAYFLGTNRNKRSLALDLSKEASKPILDRLLRSSDVLIHNVPKQSSRAKLGIDADRAMAINPALIWVSISGFGLTGPEAEKPGYDVLAQGMSGTMALTGEPESGPMRFPTPMADITSALYATIAVLGALYERRDSGAGQVVDIALLDGQATWLSNVASAYLATENPPRKRGNAHPNIAPYQPFRAKDGWLIIAVGTEAQWARFLDVLPDSAALREDSRFRTNADRVANREALEEALNSRLAGRTVEEWIGSFGGAGIPCGPILTPEAALVHPQLLAREMVVRMAHPKAGDVRTLGNPIKLSRTPTVTPVAAPTLGQHTREVLEEIGFSHREVDEAYEKGVAAEG
jgi:crotonobetainyl-CoA:carnitine CoA-transferase CaiB-like acyl-CoA transferase